MRGNKHSHIALLTCAILAFCPISSADPGTTSQTTLENEWEGHAEKTFTMKFEATPPTEHCKSNTVIEYQQRSDVANVSGEITVDDCTNVSGAYTISIRIRDEDGGVQNLDFEEVWERSDIEPYLFASEYVIGDNVDLVRVRARRSRCICNDDKEQSETGVGE